MAAPALLPRALSFLELLTFVQIQHSFSTQYTASGQCLVMSAEKAKQSLTNQSETGEGLFDFQ